MVDDKLFDVDFSSLTDTEPISMEEVNSGTAEEKTSEEGETTEEVTEEETTKKTAETKKEPEPDTLDIETISGETSEEETEETEEVVDKKEKISISKETKTAPGSEGDSSPISPFASLLHEKGFLPNLNWDKFNESDNKVDALAEAMRSEIAIANNNFINSLPPELIDTVKAVANGVPLDALKGPVLKQIDYSKIGETELKDDVELQKKIIKEGLAIKGFKTKKISKLIETYEDIGSLEEESKDTLEDLQEHYAKEQEYIKQQYAQQQEQLEQQNKATIHHIQSSIDGVDEIIPGVKLNKTTRDRLFHNMTQIVREDEQGTPQNFVMAMRSENPIGFDLAVTYLADVTKGFTDWSKIKKAGKTNAVKDFEKALGTTSHTPGRPKGDPLSETGAEESLMDSLATMFPSNNK
jgi:hypothetical protein